MQLESAELVVLCARQPARFAEQEDVTHILDYRSFVFVDLNENDRLLSTAVEKILLRCVGKRSLRSMMDVMTPSVVSMPRVKGVLSSRTMFEAKSCRRMMAPWTAAPQATASAVLRSALLVPKREGSAPGFTPL